MPTLPKQWTIATTNDSPHRTVESKLSQWKFGNMRLKTRETNWSFSFDKGIGVLTDDDDKDQKEKSEEIIVLVFPNGREDKE